MNQLLPARAERKGFSARRLVLLASAAGLAIAVTAGAPSSFNEAEASSFHSACLRGQRSTIGRICRHCREGEAGRNFGPRQD